MQNVWRSIFYIFTFLFLKQFYLKLLQTRISRHSRLTADAQFTQFTLKLISKTKTVARGRAREARE